MTFAPTVIKGLNETLLVERSILNPVSSALLSVQVSFMLVVEAA